MRWLVQTACELRLIVATATHPAAKFSTCDHVERERERESVLVWERDIENGLKGVSFCVGEGRCVNSSS